MFYSIIGIEELWNWGIEGVMPVGGGRHKPDLPFEAEVTLEVWFCLYGHSLATRFSSGQESTCHLLPHHLTPYLFFLPLLRCRWACCSIFNQRLWWRLGSTSWNPCNFLFGCGRSLKDRRRAKKRKSGERQKETLLNSAGCLFIAFWPYPTKFNVNSTVGNPAPMSMGGRCEGGAGAGAGAGGGHDWRSEAGVVISKWRLEHKQADTWADLRHRPSVNRLGSCAPPKCSILTGVVIELCSLRAIKATSSITTGGGEGGRMTWGYCIRKHFNWNPYQGIDIIKVIGIMLRKHPYTEEFYLELLVYS